MSTSLALLGAVAVGTATGALLVPVTRRQLETSSQRSMAGNMASPPASLVATSPPVVSGTQRAVLAAASGLIPAYVLHRVGWSAIAVPPLILLVGLIQLAYCDLMRRLLPRALVHGLTLAVITSGVLVAGALHEWPRLGVAGIGAVVLFVLFFGINLANPRWLAFGDVRLSLVVGFGMAWVSPMALLECVCVANLMAAFIGLVLIAAHRAERSSGMPFGLYLAIGVALVLATSHI